MASLSCFPSRKAVGGWGWWVLPVLNIHVTFSLRNYDSSALYSFTWPHQEEGGNGKLLPRGGDGGGGGGLTTLKIPITFCFEYVTIPWYSFTRPHQEEVGDDKFLSGCMAWSFQAQPVQSEILLRVLKVEKLCKSYLQLPRCIKTKKVLMGL